jgi:hypothetical protein
MYLARLPATAVEWRHHLGLRENFLALSCLSTEDKVPGIASRKILPKAILPRVAELPVNQHAPRA